MNGNGKCNMCEGKGYTWEYRPYANIDDDDVPSEGGGGNSNDNKRKCVVCGGSGTCEAPSLGYIANKQYCWGNKKCRPCGGTGQQKNIITGEYYACTYCNKEINKYYGDGICGKCGGSGKCKNCGGDGYK